MIITNIIPHYNSSFYARVTSELQHSYNVTVIADQDSDSSVFISKEDTSDINVVSLPFIQSERFTYRKNLIRTLRGLDADKVVIYANPRDISVWLTLVYLKLSRKWVATYGMFHRIGGMNRFSRTAYKLFDMLSERMFTYSRRGAVTLDALGVKASKIKVIGTAIDNKNEMRDVGRDTKIQFIESNKLEGRKLILQVVRLSSYKNPRLIIDAAKKMSSKDSSLLFVLIGGGELFETLKKEVRQLGLEQSVRLLGPCYDKEQLSLWFSVAKLSVVPTCIGLSAHHSLGFGVPVMTDDSVANQASEFDILQHGLNALIYKEGSIDDFILKLENFLNDEDMQSKLSQGAMSTIKYCANLENKVHNFIDALSQ